MAALLLSVLGGAAVMEIRKLVHKDKSEEEVHMLRKSEAKLKKLLQDVEVELEKEKSLAHEATAKVAELSEAAQKLEKVKEELEQVKEELERESENLRNENGELVEHAESLVQRQTVLERCAETLQIENDSLLEQVEKMKLEHEEETYRHAEQLEALRRDVAASLDRFAAGGLTAGGFLGHLRALGCEVHCSEDSLLKLTEAGQAGDSQPGHLELTSNKQAEGWSHQLRLVSDSPERLARLLSASSHYQALTASDGGAGSSAPRQIGFPSVKTPPKDRVDGSRLFLNSAMPNIVQALTPRGKENSTTMMLERGKPAAEGPATPRGKSVNTNVLTETSKQTASLLFLPPSKAGTSKNTKSTKSFGIPTLPLGSLRAGSGSQGPSSGRLSMKAPGQMGMRDQDDFSSNSSSLVVKDH